MPHQAEAVATRALVGTTLVGYMYRGGCPCGWRSVTKTGNIDLALAVANEHVAIETERDTTDGD